VGKEGVECSKKDIEKRGTGTSRSPRPSQKDEVGSHNSGVGGGGEEGIILGRSKTLPFRHREMLEKRVTIRGGKGREKVTGYLTDHKTGRDIGGPNGSSQKYQYPYLGGRIKKEKLTKCWRRYVLPAREGAGAGKAKTFSKREAPTEKGTPWTPP